MAAGLWVLAVVWACWAGRLCSGVEDSFGEIPDIDYQFDSNYIAMKKAASGINIPNPDVMVMYGMEAASLHYAVTHKLSYLCHKQLHTNASKVYVDVLNGECVPPPSRSHARCLTERDARMLMLKEARLTLYSAAAMVTEAGVRTRLQWFKENGVDDIVFIISANVQNWLSDLYSALHAPVRNFFKIIYKFRNIVVDRHTSGTGSAEKMVLTADSVFSEVHAIMGAIISKRYHFHKFYHSTRLRVKQYSAMFQDHLEAVLSMPQQEIYKDSPYPFINRYWDARALEYAITWLFKMRKEANVPDTKEFDNVLEDLYTKLKAGDTEEALQFAGRLLSKAMDRLGHRILDKYLKQNYKIPMSVLLLPPNLEDLNPFGVPRSRSEAKISPMENLLHHYLDEVEEESVSK